LAVIAQGAYYVRAALIRTLRLAKKLREGNRQIFHGQSGFREMLATSGLALQGPPLLGLGDGVLDADPLGWQLVVLRFPAGGAFWPGFFGGALTWPGKSRARPW
jgi:hypothetical protein